MAFRRINLKGKKIPIACAIQNCQDSKLKICSLCQLKLPPPESNFLEALPSHLLENNILVVSSNKIQNALLVMIIPSLFYSSLMFWSLRCSGITHSGRKKSMNVNLWSNDLAGWTNKKLKLLMPEKRPL